MDAFTQLEDVTLTECFDEGCAFEVESIRLPPRLKTLNLTFCTSSLLFFDFVCQLISRAPPYLENLAAKFQPDGSIDGVAIPYPRLNGHQAELTKHRTEHFTLSIERAVHRAATIETTEFSTFRESLKARSPRADDDAANRLPADFPVSEETKKFVDGTKSVSEFVRILEILDAEAANNLPDRGSGREID